MEWNEGYEVGIADIDAQHQELFRQISRLIDAMHDAKGKDVVASTLDFLSEYATKHFALEEALMTAHRYRGKADHLREHAEFVATFTALSAQLRSQGPTAALAIEVNNKICNWLVRHVLGTDKPLGNHLKLLGLK
jgi:hemerythrin